MLISKHIVSYDVVENCETEVITRTYETIKKHHKNNFRGNLDAVKSIIINNMAITLAKYMLHSDLYDDNDVVTAEQLFELTKYFIDTLHINYYWDEMRD